MFGFKKKRRTRRRRSLPRSSGHSLSPDAKRGILIIVLFTVSLFSILSFFEATGNFGVATTKLLGSIFGWGDWVAMTLLLILSYFLIRPGKYKVRSITYIGFFITIFGLSGLLHLFVHDLPLREIAANGQGGGYIGFLAGHYIYKWTALFGAIVILLAVTLIGSFMFFNASFGGIIGAWQSIVERITQWKMKRLTGASNGGSDEDYEAHFAEDETEEGDLEDEEENAEDETEEGDLEDEEENETESTKTKKPVRKQYPKITIPIDLLTSSNEVPASGDVKATMKKIEQTLKSFGIEVTMGEVNVGPTVTQYTLKPLEGVKLTQITALNSDLALALAAHPIRIEAPIPGKSLVGIEVPNQAVSLVKLKDILQSSVYGNRKSNLMVALGKDVTGRAIMADLGKMPHLLIAGATGSGKSVAINSMLVSLLYQNSPELLKIILIDPKRVELSTYDGIPHLIAPVVTDIEKTVNALRWAVNQMDERYKLLSAAGKKNIESYNASRLVDKMPYIIIIVDELADLMMVASKEVESAIIRLAQMARAVGVHLILATQRPSVNVITGLIKANITSRIAFSVASLTDSRTIIDSSGAEKLLGNGDLLYISAELSKPKRIQGAFISEKEANAITDYLKERGEPDYDLAVTERKSGIVGSSGGFESTDEERDLHIATEVVIKAKRASATLLQSRMRIGFAKASRLLDLLEERGIIGPQNSSKPREVLITQDEFDQQTGGFEDESAEQEEETEGEYESEEEEDREEDEDRETSS